MDKELMDFLGRQFDRIEGRFDQADQRFIKIERKLEEHDNKFEEVKSYVGVIFEDLRSELKAIVEGYRVVQRKIL